MSDIKVDGYANFNGGMSTSVGPSVLSKNQYVFSVNCIIPKSSDGIQTRFGFRNIIIKFDISKYKEIWDNGNPQGCGSYRNKKGEVVLVYSISGYIFELTGNSFIKNAKVINQEDQNNPLIKNCWMTRVPGGIIINNGFDLPLFTNGEKVVRPKESKREIGVGLMGAYIQNRFWYVTPNRKEIRASTIKQPLSFDEAILSNIYGVVAPEEDSKITAIGKLGTIARDAAGGNLAFATERDFYSADVRGPRGFWGSAAQQGTGFVDNILPGIGAVSGNSFETVNGNIYFRNPVYGLVSLNQGRSDFQNKDSYTDHTTEGSLFFDNDTSHMLDSCYTKSYKKSIYTTIAPEYNCDKFVFWNGIIVKTPDPYYGRNKEQQQDVVESVFTGLRPWNINITDSVDQQMFILSRDYDCVNRLYLYDENTTSDINSKNERVLIESQIRTRSFDFEQSLFPKSPENKFYSLSNIRKNTTIIISSRESESSEFKEYSKLNFVVEDCSNKKLSSCGSCHDSIENISLSENSSNRFFSIQDNIFIKGWCLFKRYIRVAKIMQFDKIVYKEQIKREKEKCDKSKIFTYKISK